MINTLMLNNPRPSPLSGFTMIELLMVIMLVGILGAVALPQFLDFRREARIAVATQVAQSVATGIKLQHKQAILKCRISAEAQLPLGSLEQNDVTAGVGALCTRAQLPNESDRKIFDGPIGLFPINPVTNLRTIGLPSTLDSGETFAENGTCAASSVGTAYGWCYAPSTGEFFAANDSTGGGTVAVTAGSSSSGGLPEPVWCAEIGGCWDSETQLCGCGVNAPQSDAWNWCLNNYPTSGYGYLEGSGCVMIPGYYCGNWQIDPLNGEDCDDGNVINDDGCDSNCVLEAP